MSVIALSATTVGAAGRPPRWPGKPTLSIKVLNSPGAVIAPSVNRAGATYGNVRASGVLVARFNVVNGGGCETPNKTIRVCMGGATVMRLVGGFPQPVAKYVAQVNIWRDANGRTVRAQVKLHKAYFANNNDPRLTERTMCRVSGRALGLAVRHRDNPASSCMAGDLNAPSGATGIDATDRAGLFDRYGTGADSGPIGPAVAYEEEDF